MTATEQDRALLRAWADVQRKNWGDAPIANLRAAEAALRILDERDALHAKCETLLAEQPFRCPKCGGSWFGTANPAERDPTLLRINCHDEHGEGCRWSGTWAEHDAARFAPH